MHPTCKKCTRLRSIKWQKDNPEWYKELSYKKNRNPNLKTKETWLNNARKQRKNGYRKDWEINNKDKLKIYAQNHRKHDITTKEWIANRKFFKDKDDEWCCAYCGMTEKEHKSKYKEQLHKEHVEHEGYNDVRNSVPACKDCNSSKKQHDMETWFREQEFFTEEKLTKIKEWCEEEYKKYIELKPPYRITKKQNEDGRTYYFLLWTVDDKRNLVECVATGNRKKDLKIYIRDIFNQ